MTFQQFEFFTLKTRRYARPKTAGLVDWLFADIFHPYFKKVFGSLKG